MAIIGGVVALILLLFVILPAVLNVENASPISHSTTATEQAFTLPQTLTIPSTDWAILGASVAGVILIIVVWLWRSRG
jgi:hypothetical protein